MESNVKQSVKTFCRCLTHAGSVKKFGRRIIKFVTQSHNSLYRPDSHSHHCAEVATPHIAPSHRHRHWLPCTHTHHRSPTCPPPTHATHLSNMLVSCFPAQPLFTNPAPACSPPYTPAFNMNLTTYPTTAQTIARLPTPHPPTILSDLLFPSLPCGRTLARSPLHPRVQCWHGPSLAHAVCNIKSGVKGGVKCTLTSANTSAHM